MLLFALVVSAHAVTHTVSTTADNLTPPVGSLREAVAAAGSGDTIDMATACCGTACVINLVAPLVTANPSVTVDFSACTVILNGGVSDLVFLA